MSHSIRISVENPRGSSKLKISNWFSSQRSFANLVLCERIKIISLPRETEHKEGQIWRTIYYSDKIRDLGGLNI